MNSNIVQSRSVSQYLFFFRTIYIPLIEKRKGVEMMSIEKDYREGNSSVKVQNNKIHLNNVTDDCPIFITVANTDVSKPLITANIFLLNKSLEQIINESNRLYTSFDKEGNILILIKSKLVAEQAMKLTSLPGLCEISCSMHKTLNTVRGIIHAPQIKNLAETEILEGLNNLNITNVKKITKCINGQVLNTPLHIISFFAYNLPKEIKIGFCNIKVKPFIPRPIQCRKCYKYGHTKKHCKVTSAICNSCGEVIHDNTPCRRIACVNCIPIAAHESTSKECPIYIYTQEILKVKTLNKMSFSNAREYVNQSSITSSIELLSNDSLPSNDNASNT